MLSRPVAYSFFVGGCVLVCWSNAWFEFSFMGLQSVLAIVGLMLLLGRSIYRSSLLVFPSSTYNTQYSLKRMPAVSYYSSLFLLQILLTIVSLVFFLTVEHITQFNPRLQPLLAGQILLAVQANTFSIGILPWVLYGVTGVALAYFSVCKEKPPTLAHTIAPEAHQHPGLFVHNYIFIATEAVKLCSVMFLLILSIIWLCEGFSTVMQWPSIFKTPMKGIIIASLMMIAFRKPHQNLLEWLRKKHIPLGGMLVLYALFFSLFIIWGYGVGDWLLLGHEETDPNKVVKSILAGSFSKESENNRLIFLIWGWWGLWLPWVASIIARLSLGRTVWEACLSSILFPMVLFFGVNHFVTLAHWQWLTIELQKASIQLGIAFFLIFMMILFFGHIHASKDILRGGMLSFGKLSGVRPLRQWVNLCIMITMFNLPGLFMLGWLPFQILATLGTVFITTVVVGLISVLFSSKGLFLAVKKYRVQDVP
jgi:choline-glycine betaine transporter